MYRIRFHGRGGQGMKTASRILGTAFFLAGFEVQDAPRYGAERRGAPMFAYVRASQQAINERGIIVRPSLVVVSDDSLIAMAAAGVLAGLTADTPLLICSPHDPTSYQKRFDLKCQVITFALPDTAREQTPLSSTCAAAAAALTDCLRPEHLEQAVRQELTGLAAPVLAENIEAARRTYDSLAAWQGLVKADHSSPEIGLPQWLDLPLEDAAISAPVIHAPATSLKMNTGLWRTLRPVPDHELCISCGLCATYCPDGAISMDEQDKPQIDYQHCKGCLICLAQCPAHAITAKREEDES